MGHPKIDDGGSDIGRGQEREQYDGDGRHPIEAGRARSECQRGRHRDAQGKDAASVAGNACGTRPAGEALIPRYAVRQFPLQPGPAFGHEVVAGLERMLRFARACAGITGIGGSLGLS